MPSPVFPTAYKVSVQQLYFSQLIENVWYCQGPDPFDATVADTIAGIFQTDYVTIASGLSQDLQITGIAIQNLAGTASGSFTLAISPPQTGGRVQDGLPGNVTFCVSLHTALASRRTRGRKYFSGLGEADVTGNSFDTSQGGAILTGISNMIGNLAANSTPLCIFSPTGLTLVPVISAVAVDYFVDSQRRRLTGRGR